MGHIYGLVGADDVIRYIGLTFGSLSARWSSHKYMSAKLATPAHRWIRENADDIRVVLLDTVPNPLLRERERLWISLARAAGRPLVNMSHGGQFVPDNRGRVHSEEFREKRRQIMTGQKRSAETKERISASRMGSPGNGGQHARWHRDRGVISPNCSYCKGSV